MSVEVRHLTFSYGKRQRTVLTDVSLKVEDGSVCLLLGLNGCGKTTLIKSMAGLLRYAESQVFYQGDALKSLSMRDRSRRFAYVPQTIFGANDVVVGDYLLYGMVNVLKFYESPSRREREKAEAMSRELGVHDLLRKKLGEVSGGERQKIALCGALLQDAGTLLLDEPTSALDLRNQHMILQKLKEIAAAKGKTVVLSSHNPNHALFLDCDAALMQDGRILRQGAARDLVTTDALREVYGDRICLSRDLPYDEISFSDATRQ